MCIVYENIENQGREYDLNIDERLCICYDMLHKTDVEMQNIASDMKIALA